MSLRREADAAQQAGEARVGVKAAQQLRLFPQGEKVRAFLISLFQPREGLVVLLQTGGGGHRGRAVH